MGDARDLRVLLRDALRPVDEQQHHVGALHGSDGADDAVALDLLLHLILAAQPGGVNQNILPAVVFHRRVNGIPGSTRKLRDDHTRIPRQPVHKGGFSHIRLSDNRDLRPLILLICTVLPGEVLHNLIQQLAEPEHPRTGNRKRLTHAKIVKFIDVHHQLFKAVHLVHRQNHRLFRAPQHVGDLRVRILQPLAHVHKKNNDIRRIDCHLRLLTHLG